MTFNYQTERPYHRGENGTAHLKPAPKRRTTHDRILAAILAFSLTMSVGCILILLVLCLRSFFG